MSTNTVIIGGGLTGLFLAHRLQRGGHTVTLLEARETLGGRYKRASQSQPYSSPGLDLIPSGQEQMALLEWLKNHLPIPLNLELREHYPQIFDEGKWRPFAGFGESNFQSVGELSALFGHTHHVDLQPPLEQITRALVEQLPIEAQTMSEVTGFKVAEGKVTEVVVNGDKSIKADSVIFTPPPALANNFFAGEDLPIKHRTRLAKMQSWTAVTLELQHEPALVDDSSVRFFTHNAKEFEPVVGRVFGATSKWMTLVPGDREADHEFAGQCIRHIKRQLKRAWPLAFEGSAKTNEKIYVQLHAYGQHSLRAKETYRFPEISNFYLANHALASLPGELGALEPVKVLAEQLCQGHVNQLPELGASC
jgi:hypothetical protein